MILLRMKSLALALFLGCNVCVSCEEPLTQKQVVNAPLSNTEIDSLVDKIYASLSTEQRVAQLHGIRPNSIMKDRKLCRELCDSLIPYGVGHISQFACMIDLQADELRDFVKDLQAYVMSRTDAKIPAIFHEEAITGFSSLGATTYPQQIGVACSWNPSLLYQKSDYTRESMREIGSQFALSPMVDVIRTQHFNRGEESYGEDGYLSSCYGVQFIKGLQGEDLKTGIAATTKHFLGYGGGMDHSEKEIIEEILLPHETAIRVAGSKSIMPGYHSYKGETSITNTYFLQDILREYLKFDGIVVSDYGATACKWAGKGDPNHLLKRAKAAMNAGADLELSGLECFIHLPALVESGDVDKKRFEEAVKQNLRMKARLGLLDKNPKLYEEGSINLNKDKYDKLAYDIAKESIVLLKNNGVLPLKAKKIALLGPNASSHWAMLGDYTYQALHAFFQSGKVDSNNPKIYTLKEGMLSAKPKDVKISYERACDWDASIKTAIEKGGDSRIELSKLDKLVMMLREESDPTSLTKAINKAKNSDVVVAAVGENAALCGEGRIRKGIRLPGAQIDFVEQLIDCGKPVVVVIFGGRAQVLSKKILTESAAIIQAWYPGQNGGNAVADILFGKVNPSAKLSTSYPATESQESISYTYGEDKMKGLVEFPFGYGLSYTKFEYSNIKCTKETEIKNGQIEVAFKIKNIGNYDGSEIAQLYISPKNQNENYKPIQLKGFNKINLKKDESKLVKFYLNTELFSYYDTVTKMWICAPEEFIIKIGSSSSDIKLQSDVKLIGDMTKKELRDNYFSTSEILTIK